MKNYTHSELMDLANKGYLFHAKGLRSHHDGDGKHLGYIGPSDGGFVFGLGSWMQINTKKNLVDYHNEIQVKPINPNRRKVI